MIKNKGLRVHHILLAAVLLLDARGWAKEDKVNYCNTICYKDVHKAVSNNTMIIDVRPKQEVADSGLIPTSINIPLSCLRSKLEMSKADFKEEFFHLKPRKRDMIILTGRCNTRNTDAAQCLAELGYSKIFDYVGGYDEWDHKMKEAKGKSCDECAEEPPPPPTPCCDGPPAPPTCCENPPPPPPPPCCDPPPPPPCCDDPPPPKCEKPQKCGRVAKRGA